LYPASLDFVPGWTYSRYGSIFSTLSLENIERK